MADKEKRLLTSATGWFLFGLSSAIGLCLLSMVGAILFTAIDGLSDGRFVSMDEAARLIGPLFSMIAILALVLAFLWTLRKIVISAEESPFTLENARRLQRMAWIALAWHLTVFAFAMAGKEINLVSVQGLRIRLVDAYGVSATGPILVLALFILAHVFRKGSDMREELDGTV